MSGSVRADTRLSIAELIDAGRLTEAAEREALACERDGFPVTARLLRALLAATVTTPPQSALFSDAERP